MNSSCWSGCQAVDWSVSGDAPEKVDHSAELQLKWGTARGQLWRVGRHHLICGDCREPADVRRLWREGGPKLRMVWTDPPYGVDYAAKNAYLNRTDRGNRIQKPIINEAPKRMEMTGKDNGPLTIELFRQLCDAAEKEPDCKEDTK